MAAKDFVINAVIFLLILNAVPSVMEASGFNDANGIDVNLGIQEKKEEIDAELDKGFSPDASVVESFVSVAVAAMKTVQLIFQSITAFPSLLESLGAPVWLVDPLDIIMKLIATLAGIYVATGRRFGR